MMLERSPTSRRARRRERAREQQRRHRRRAAAGLVWVGSDFSPAETAKLHRLRYLTESELEDPQRIAAALHALLASIIA